MGGQLARPISSSVTVALGLGACVSVWALADCSGAWEQGWSAGEVRALPIGCEEVGVAVHSALPTD